MDLSTLFHVFVLIGLMISGMTILVLRELLSAVIGLAVFSLLLALEFYILQAPDVAIAEAAMGAGLTTAIFVIALRGSKGKEEVE